MPINWYDSISLLIAMINANTWFYNSDDQVLGNDSSIFLPLIQAINTNMYRFHKKYMVWCAAELQREDFRQ